MRTKKLQIFHFLFIGTLVLSVFLPSLVYAAVGVPKIINFQGRLMDSSGNLLGSAGGTDYCYKFSIWDISTGGTANPNQIWPSGFATPTTMTIPTRLGVFDASIGGAGGDTLDFDFQSNNTVYVNVQVATKVGATCAPGDGAESFETLDPRPQIVSAGYAINSGTVGGFTPAQSATGNQIPALTSGALILGDATLAGLKSTGSNPLAVDAGTSGILNLNNTSTGNILFGGGSGSTGCTLTNSTGAFACSVGISSGVAGASIGAFNLSGNTSGTISILPQAAAGTYNFNLPTTAGNSGEILTSAGGSSSPMTWTAPGALAVRWSSLAAPTSALSLTMPATNETTFTIQSTTQTGFTWQSSTLTSGMLGKFAITGSSAVATAAGSGSGLTISSTTTGFTAAPQTLAAINSSGANTNNGVTVQGLSSSVTNTNATSGTNVALYLNASGATTANYGLIVNSGSVGIGDTSPASLFTVGSGDLFQINSSGQIGSQQAPVSDYLFALAGTTGNDHSRIIDITQANDSAENSVAINIANTSNLGTITGSNLAIGNISQTLNPIMTFGVTGGIRSVNINSNKTDMSLSGITFSDSGGVSATAQVYGDSNTVSGSPVVSDTNTVGTNTLTIFGTSNTVNVSPTWSSSTDTMSFNTYGGQFANTASSTGDALLTSLSYGIYAVASGNLTTTGDTTHYGGSFQAGGTANTNYGIYVSAFGATNNYAAIFDQGNVGIGTTTPTAVLHLKAGTTTANTAPLKFTSGSLLTTAEAGAVEFLTDAFYGTITTGAARKTFAFLESPSFTTPALGVATYTTLSGGNITDSALTAARVTFAGTGGLLSDDADLTFVTDTLSATKLLSSTSVSTPSLISTGALTITPASGSNVNVSLATTGDLAVNTNQLYVDTSAGTVGIGTASPTSTLHIVQAVSTTGTPTGFTFAGGAHTTLSNAEVIDTNFNLARTVQFGQSTTLALQRAAVIQAPTYSTSSLSKTITDAITLAITGAPVKSGNVAITNTYALKVQAGAVSTATNSYGLFVDAQTGATNNYAAIFAGGNVGVGTTAPAQVLEVQKNQNAVSAIRITNTDAGNAAYGSLQFQNDTAILGGFFSLSSANTAYGGANSINIVNSTNNALAFGTNDLIRMYIRNDGTVGIGTTGPDRALEINNVSGNNLRLTYNDADGSAANYVDLLTTSGGALSVRPSGFITNIGGGTSVTAMRFLEPSGTGTDYAGIQSNANVTTSYTWTLPAADASGCIQSNGSGTLSVSSCGGSSPTLNSILAATGNGTAQNSGAFTAQWDWDSITTQRGLTLGGGTNASMTTGGVLAIGSANMSYAHGAVETGSLATITFKDTTTAVFATTTNGLLISPTINAASGAATRTINGLSVAPALTTCGAGTCTLNGLNVTGATAGSNFTENGLNISAITAGAGTETGIKVGSGWDAGFNIGSGGNVITQPATTSGAGSPGLTYTGGAHTNNSASEYNDVLFNFTRTIGKTTTGIVRAFKITSPTVDYTSFNTMSEASNLFIDGAPTATSNVFITQSSSLKIGTATLNNVRNAFGLYIDAPSATYSSGGEQGNLNGIYVNLPAVTNLTMGGATQTYTSTGVKINSGNVTVSTGDGGGTSIGRFVGADIVMPATVTTNTDADAVLNAYGLQIKTPTTTTQTTGTLTSSGIHIAATGAASGTFNGINISDITGGSGTESAIKIGSGWDNQISGNGWSVSGSGALTVASCSGCGAGGSTTWDTIGDAAGNGAIAMGATVQTMDWATATTQAAMTFNANALTTGDLLTLAHTTSVIADGGSLLRITSSSADTGGATNGTLADFSASGTVTGKLVKITSTAASQTSTTLLDVVASGYTTGYTGNVANFTGVSTTGAGNVLNITTANTTAGSGLNIAANALTTGTALIIPHTTSVIADTGSLLRISSSSIDTGGATNGTLADFSASATVAGKLVKIRSTAASQTSTTLLDVVASGYTTGYTGNVANFTGVSTTGAGNVLNITTANTTAGSGLNIAANALTTGTALIIPHTTSVIADTGSLLRISSSSADTGGATNGTLLDLSSTASTSGILAKITNNTASFTGTALAIIENGVSTGKTFTIASSATGVSTAGTNVGSLLDIAESGAMTTMTGNLVAINASGTNTSGSTGALLKINMAGTAQLMQGISIVDAGTTTAGSSGITIQKPAATTNGLRYLRFMDATPTQIGSITNSAAATIAYNTTSDARLKEDTGNAAAGLSELMNLEVHNFKWKYYDSVQNGFFAQQLYTIVPEAVTVGDDTVDSEGRLLNPWQVDYGRVTPLIVQAIQDQQVLINGISLQTMSDGTGIQNITDQINQLAEGQVAFNLTASVMNALSAAVSQNQADITGLQMSVTSMNDRITSLENLFGANTFDALTSVTTSNLSVTGDGTYSGKSQFDGLSFFSSETNFDGLVNFGASVEFNLPPIFNRDSGGFAIIKEGDRRVRIEFEREYAIEPVVNTNITFETDDEVDDEAAVIFFDTGVQSVVTEKDTTGFTILLNMPAPRDIRFSWTSVAIKDPELFESLFEGLTIDSEPESEQQVTPAQTPTPQPEPVPEPEPALPPEIQPDSQSQPESEVTSPTTPAPEQAPEPQPEPAQEPSN